MPTLGNRYTIQDLCTQIGTTPPWIRKVEAEGILEPVEGPSKGRRRFYSPQELSILSDVFVLRGLGFQFEDIIYLKNLELELANLAQKALKATVHKSNNDQWINTIFYGTHNGELLPLSATQRAELLGKVEEHERLLAKIQEALRGRIRLLTQISEERIGQTWLTGHRSLSNHLRAK